MAARSTRANPEVDAVVQKLRNWKLEIQALREIMLQCPVTEELKWYQPCYTHDGSNVAILGSFKNYCAIGFFKGVLLKDPEGLLQRPGKNSQSVKLLRFTEIGEIRKLKKVIIAYVTEAVELEKAGNKVVFKKVSEFSVPDELKAIFSKEPSFEKAFKALTPGRQRGYLLFFSAAKQPITRISRIERYRKAIMAGKGLHD